MRNHSNILFSLVIPTRSRLPLLLNCLRSFFTKALNPHTIETILMCDFDDVVMRDFDQIANNNWNIKIVFQRQSDKMIRDYNNFGAQCTTGKYIWMLNDDYEMTTNHWDHVINSNIEMFIADKPDRILYVQVDDSTHTNWGRDADWGCCCPILSQEAVDVQNGIMPVEIDMWGADIWEYRIFQKLPNRILNLIKDIKVLHHCKHNGSVQPDAISQRVSDVSKRGHLTDEEFNRYINLLSNYINKYHGIGLI